MTCWELTRFICLQIRRKFCNIFLAQKRVLIMPARKKRGPTNVTAADEISPSKKTKTSTADKQNGVRMRIVIEHCKSWQVYKRRALALADDLRETFGADLQVDINFDKPRRGAFECTLFKEDDSEVLVWTGLKKGPPRKLKFPESEDVVKEIKKALK